MRPSSSPFGARRRRSCPVPLSSLLSASPIPLPSTAVRGPISSCRHHPTSIAPLAPHPSATSSTTRRRPHLPLLPLRLHRGIQPPTSPWPSSASRCSHPIRLPPNSRHHPIRQISASTTALAVMTTVSVGDKLPDAILAYFDLIEERQTVTVWELTKGKKTVPFTASFAPLLPPYHRPLPPPHRSSRLRLRCRPGDPHPSLPLSLSLTPPPSLPLLFPLVSHPACHPSAPPHRRLRRHPNTARHRPCSPPLPIPHRKNNTEEKKKRKKRKKKEKKRKKIVRKKRGKKENFFPFFLMERNHWFRLRSALVPRTTAASAGDAPPPPPPLPLRCTPPSPLSVP